MKKGFNKKMMSLLLAASMVTGTASVMTGCGSSADKGPVTLTVYSQLANYSGEQAGWMADLLLEKFNVKLNIVPESDGAFQTRMENNDLGDIVIWGNSADQYAQAVKAGLLFDLEDEDLLHEYGPYIEENMPDALNKNRNLTATITGDENNKTLYGWGNDTATTSQNHSAFFYTWDIRWDLYKELGYPEVKDMDDLHKLLKDMQKLDPKDDAGNKTYAVSLWPDWDDAMVMYVKATATAYYGYDELGIGLYDPKTGEYHDALEENGPYLTMLKFYNDLYQDGLVDPDSMTQTYDQMSEKVQNGGVLFSIFNYSGSLGFNKDEHLEDGQYMYCMRPSEASPLVYGLNTQGGSYITSIGANTEYPDLCMEVLNYFCTPEGRLTYAYGPKDECWYYDEEGNTCLTDLGKACRNSVKTKMENHKGTFQDGQLQMAVSTWALDALNPESNNETYNADNWKSTNQDVQYDIQKDWREKTGCLGINDYMESGNYTVAPGTSYTTGTKTDELKTTWSQVTESIITDSWNAIYAKSDEEFDTIVARMKKNAEGYGYDECLAWSENEASIRRGLEEELTQ